MQHATERVERSGESQEALDGKKIFSFSGFSATPTLVDDTMISPFCQLLTLQTGQPFTLPWFLFGLFVCGCCFAVLFFPCFVPPAL